MELGESDISSGAGEFCCTGNGGGGGTPANFSASLKASHLARSLSAFSRASADCNLQVLTCSSYSFFHASSEVISEFSRASAGVGLSSVLRELEVGAGTIFDCRRDGGGVNDSVRAAWYYDKSV